MLHVVAAAIGWLLRQFGVRAFADPTTPTLVAIAVADVLPARVAVVPKHRFLLARVDDTLQSLHEPLERDCRVQFLAYNDDSAAQRCLAHSAAHTLGHALETLFDGAQLVDGPALDEHSFYYDCVLPAGRTVHANDLAPLEREMRALISSGAPFELRRATPDEARRLFADNRHKLHMIEQLASAGAAISVYRCGDFVDLCRGPHVPSLASIRSDAVHLYRVGGTHNANEHRVTGAVFAHRKLLRAWQEAREVAAQRDHRRIGTQQEVSSRSNSLAKCVVVYSNCASSSLCLARTRQDPFFYCPTVRAFDAHWCANCEENIDGGDSTRYFGVFSFLFPVVLVFLLHFLLRSLLHKCLTRLFGSSLVIGNT